MLAEFALLKSSLVIAVSVGAAVEDLRVAGDGG